jgi:hypothetical protein
MLRERRWERIESDDWVDRAVIALRTDTIQ